MSNTRKFQQNKIGKGFYKYGIFILILSLLTACGGKITAAPTATIPPPTATPDQAILLPELIQAIRDHNATEVQRLLDAGVDVNIIQSFMQLTPLALASYEGDTTIVTLLLDRGADVAMYNKNQYGTTALIEAASQGQTEVVKLLLERGADINQRDRAGDPALNWATYYGHIDVVRLLIDQKADLTVVGSGGGTALKTAIAQKHKEIEQLLRDAGATE
ncbi:MAG: ankyrin repeat domain-containing protein [Chloroflexi bacterium]|nr:ankyrin repeat domain-containing protein [Chloroflexota bacterium]